MVYWEKPDGVVSLKVCEKWKHTLEKSESDFFCRLMESQWMFKPLPGTVEDYPIPVPTNKKKSRVRGWIWGDETGSAFLHGFS